MEFLRASNSSLIRTNVLSGATVVRRVVCGAAGVARRRRSGAVDFMAFISCESVARYRGSGLVAAGRYASLSIELQTS